MRNFPTYFSCSTPRAELIEVSAEFPAKLPADFVAARCNHRQRWPKNWRERGIHTDGSTACSQEVFLTIGISIPSAIPARKRRFQKPQSQFFTMRIDA